MRVMSLLFSPRYQLFSEATPRKIGGTEGTVKVLLPEYQVYKCFIILYPHTQSISVYYYTSVSFFNRKSSVIF
jgi:hypothetical protein